MKPLRTLPRRDPRAPGVDCTAIEDSFARMANLAGDWRQTGRRPPSGPRRVRFPIMVRQAAAREMTDSEIIDGLRDAAVDEENGRLVHCETEDDLRTFFSTLRTDEG
jgi:hypothetical protein